jgi:hypothetical protein
MHGVHMPTRARQEQIADSGLLLHAWFPHANPCTARGWHSDGEPPVHAQAVMRYLVEKCNARLHWGKAGWPWLEPCYDGSAHYANWCDFGCAVEVTLSSPLPTSFFLY